MYSVKYTFRNSTTAAIFPCPLKTQHGWNEKAVIRPHIGPVVELARADGDPTIIARLDQLTETIIELAVNDLASGG